MDSFERPGNPLFDVGFVRAGSDTNINRSCRAMSHLLPINWSALGGSVDQQIANCKATLRALEPKGSLTTAEQAGYKMVLVLEGNGAASSMSWVLASGSTALIPTPTSAEATLETSRAADATLASLSKRTTTDAVPNGRMVTLAANG